ncbi:hypothetical protein [Pseudomonas sp.]|uniref:hypothetical protein n=1 Tax=Pseudomonas sp. TaxID=306 RepID=UPI00258C722C|nr:hypothetical protein [Pseudomonas sp.]
MGSKYIQSIDLEVLCKVLPGFAGGRVHPEALQSLGGQIAGSVLAAFRSFLKHPDLQLFGDVPKKISPKGLAELLDEVLATVWESNPNISHKVRLKARDKKGLPPEPGRFVYREAVGRICTEGPSLDALLIYHLDKLCSAQRAGQIDAMLALIPDMLAIQSDIGEREGRTFSHDMLDISTKHEARQRAELRHKPTNQRKAALLTEWDATASEYESRADFARIVSQREGLKYRTLYDWIAAHDRTKA